MASIEKSKELIENTQAVTIVPKDKRKDKLLDALVPDNKYKFLDRKFAEDLLNLYQKPKEYSFDGYVDDNQTWWANLLTKFNNPVIKNVTNNNYHLNEVIMPHYFNALDKVLEYADELEEQEKQEQSGGNGGLSLDDLMPKQGKGKGGGGNSLEQMIQKEIEKANKEISKELQNAPEELLDAGDDGNSPSKGIGSNPDMQLSPQGYEYLYDLQKRIKFNKDALNRFIQKTIAKVKNTFKNPTTTENIDFFETEDFSELYDVEWLAVEPLVFLEEIFSKESKFGTLINISLDQSGSMNSNVKLGNGTVFLPDLCKYLVYAMAKNDIVNNVSVFDTQVYPTTLEQLLTNRFSGGGTSIDTVIKKSIKEGDEPLLIITDKQLCPTIMRK